MKAALLLLALSIGGNPPIEAQGRTWVWNAGLGMYQPEGKNWQYDADRGTWWRDEKPRSQWSTPRPGESLWREMAPGDWWWWNVQDRHWHRH